MLNIQPPQKTVGTSKNLTGTQPDSAPQNREINESWKVYLLFLALLNVKKYLLAQNIIIMLFQKHIILQLKDKGRVIFSL